MYKQDLPAAANCTFSQFSKNMLEEVLLMPKEIVHSASERGRNDIGKRKLIFDTVFLSGVIKHPAFLCLDQVPSPLSFTFTSLSCVSLFTVKHSKETVLSRSCQGDRINSTLVWIWTLGFIQDQ